MHAGLLSVDSPALFSKITKLFTAAECAVISALYALTVERAGLEHTSIVRESCHFNPRPGRIGRILTDVSNASPIEVGAGIIACGFAHSANLTSDVSFTRFESEVHIAKCALSVPPDVTEAANNHSALRVRLALALDSVRHLHMQKLPARERESTLLAAQRILEDTPAGPATDSLRTLVSHALSQQSMRSVEAS